MHNLVLDEADVAVSQGRNVNGDAIKAQWLLDAKTGTQADADFYYLEILRCYRLDLDTKDVEALKAHEHQVYEDPFQMYGINRPPKAPGRNTERQVPEVKSDHI